MSRVVGGGVCHCRSADDDGRYEVQCVGRRRESPILAPCVGVSKRQGRRRMKGLKSPPAVPNAASLVMRGVPPAYDSAPRCMSRGFGSILRTNSDQGRWVKMFTPYMSDHAANGTCEVTHCCRQLYGTGTGLQRSSGVERKACSAHAIKNCSSLALPRAPPRCGLSRATS